MRKRIAVLLGQPEVDHQTHFIEGVMQQAQQADFDVCIFSMIRMYQSSAAREQGDSNIFRLINPGMFDAIILLTDTVQTPGIAAKIEEHVKNGFQGVTICVDIGSKHFPTVWTDGAAGIRHMVEHLIEEHHYEDIAFLAGKEWHPHSQERLRGYREAMEAHGLPVREERIFYGDFWYTSGNACAEQMLKDREHLPQALVCANDCMAIGFCEEMEKHGVRVPEDIAVTGFDATEEGKTSPQPLSSVEIPSKELGIQAVEYISKKLKDKTAEALKVVPGLYIGGSCGCAFHQDGFAGRRRHWRSELSTDGFLSATNEMTEDMLMQSTFADFLHTVYYYIYQLQPLESFDLCLNDQWLMPGGITESRLFQAGYTPTMLHAIHYANEGADGRVSLQETFPTKDMLPELGEDYDHPRAWLFTPLFFEAGCFGYAAVRYAKGVFGYDRTYRCWIRSVACGLEVIRRAETAKLQRANGAGDRQEAPAERKRKAEMQELTEAEQEDMKEVERLLDENLFNYFFQPIVYAKDGEIYAYEALMRAKTEKKISPLQIIRYAGLMNRLDDVERLTFLNVLNYLKEHPEKFEGKRLFINSIPGTTLDEVDKEKVDRELKLHSQTAVVELTEEAELDDAALEAMKVRYKELGINTAVDDYGTGYSNIANLLRYMPQYVKIDRSLLSGIQDNPQKQHFVREIVDFSHDNGIMALAEGVETTEELRTVIHLGVDLIQGYYTAKPNPEVLQVIDQRPKSEIRRYQRERQDGTEHRVYTAGRIGRVLLGNLAKDSFNTILVEGGEKIYRDITIVGTPGKKTDIHLEVRSGYRGRITLENVTFTNIKSRPCIDIAADCSVVLALSGENFLKGGGILVPEGAELRLEGDGDLEIRADENDYFGIGNSWKEKHGKLEFYHDGMLRIVMNGQQGIGIGAGLGGEILIHSGRYEIDLNGSRAVGIGTVSVPAEVTIHNCDMKGDVNVAKSVFAGSYERGAKVTVDRATVTCLMGGNIQAVLGTAFGPAAEVLIRHANVRLDLQADMAAVVGAVDGRTEFRIDTAMVRLEGRGKNVYAIGGTKEDTDAELLDADLRIRLRNNNGKDTLTSDDRIRMVGGRQDIEVNGKQIERAVELRDY